MRARHASVADVVPFSWVDGPGNRFVHFFQGCNFDCLACHNPQTIPVRSPRATTYTVAEVVARIRCSMPYISGVTVSGGEPTLHHEFVGELFAAVKEDDELKALTTFVDSNGNASRDVWLSLASVTDAVMLDFKALDPGKHREMTGEPNDLVKDSIVYLTQLGLLYEVRLLLVPGHNDSDAELRRTAQWLLSVDPDIRIKINAFVSHGVRGSARQWPEVKDDDKARYRSTLLGESVRHLAFGGAGPT